VYNFYPSNENDDDDDDDVDNDDDVLTTKYAYCVTQLFMTR